MVQQKQILILKHAVARVIKAESSHAGVPSRETVLAGRVNNGNDVCAIVQSIAGGRFNPLAVRALFLVVEQ